MNNQNSTKINHRGKYKEMAQEMWDLVAGGCREGVALCRVANKHGLTGRNRKTTLRDMYFSLTGNKKVINYAY